MAVAVAWRYCSISRQRFQQRLSLFQLGRCSPHPITTMSPHLNTRSVSSYSQSAAKSAGSKLCEAVGISSPVQQSGDEPASDRGESEAEMTVAEGVDDVAGRPCPADDRKGIGQRRAEAEPG